MDKVSLNAKPRYEILDGLRGVAAMLVVFYHICEGHWGMQHQPLSHGFLAVDFFFALSGFVIGYAYDDRWAKGMTTNEFFKRRITRLHPMVIVGAFVNLACMFFVTRSFVNRESPWSVALTVLLTCLMIPVNKGGEMYRLNGNQWSLFFEYVANILYATIIRRLPKKVFYGLVAAFGIWMVYYLVFDDKSGGSMVGGWSIKGNEFVKGWTRLLYPFFSGLLVYRLNKRIKVKNGFFWASVILTLIFIVPWVGKVELVDNGRWSTWVNHTPWMNGLYESLVILFVFPLIINIGAGSQIGTGIGAKVCKFLGDISFPMYITHNGYIKWYYQYIRVNHCSLGDCWYVALGVVVASILTAYIALKFYDIPVRRWLKSHWLDKKQVATNQ